MNQVLISIIRFYQTALSPYLGENCRFYPSCSHYAAEAIEQKGVWKGLGAGLKRLLRCHPFSSGGFDPLEQ